MQYRVESAGRPGTSFNPNPRAVRAVVARFADVSGCALAAAIANSGLFAAKRRPPLPCEVGPAVRLHANGIIDWGPTCRRVASPIVGVRQLVAWSAPPVREMVRA